MDSEARKQAAGYRAAELVNSGMRIGLGTGSTAFHLVRRLAERWKGEGLRFEAVSTSFSTSRLCQELGLPLLPLGAVSYLDLALDGADEIDPARNLIKGRGAAHTLEKIVAAMAKTFVVIADDSKLVEKLGSKFPVPIEVLPSAAAYVQTVLERMGAKATVRSGAPGKDGPVVSDSGNFILDAAFSDIPDPRALEIALDAIPGVVENGIFAGRASKAIIGTADGVREF